MVRILATFDLRRGGGYGKPIRYLPWAQEGKLISRRRCEVVFCFLVDFQYALLRLSCQRDGEGEVVDVREKLGVGHMEGQRLWRLGQRMGANDKGREKAKWKFERKKGRDLLLPG
jgi:hypothetical protein